jgi:hypothetical protein
MEDGTVFVYRLQAAAETATDPSLMSWKLALAAQARQLAQAHERLRTARTQEAYQAVSKERDEWRERAGKAEAEARVQAVNPLLKRISELKTALEESATAATHQYERAEKAEAELERLESQRASEADVLNVELRENYGNQHQVSLSDDWRPAIRALVDGTRHGERYQVKAEVKRLREKVDDQRRRLESIFHAAREAHDWQVVEMVEKALAAKEGGA